MSLSSVFSNIDKYVKLPEWLQMVGVVLAFGGLIAHAHWFGIPMAYVGLGVAVAGRLYNQIYP